VRCEIELLNAFCDAFFVQIGANGDELRGGATEARKTCWSASAFGSMMMAMDKTFFACVVSL
jgi:hypothetical protein